MQHEMVHSNNTVFGCKNRFYLTLLSLNKYSSKYLNDAIIGVMFHLNLMG